MEVDDASSADYQDYCYLEENKSEDNNGFPLNSAIKNQNAYTKLIIDDKKLQIELNYWLTLIENQFSLYHNVLLAAQIKSIYGCYCLFEGYKSTTVTESFVAICQYPGCRTYKFIYRKVSNPSNNNITLDCYRTNIDNFHGKDKNNKVKSPRPVTTHWQYHQLDSFNLDQNICQSLVVNGCWNSKYSTILNDRINELTGCLVSLLGYHDSQHRLTIKAKCSVKNCRFYKLLFHKRVDLEPVRIDIMCTNVKKTHVDHSAEMLKKCSSPTLELKNTAPKAQTYRRKSKRIKSQAIKKAAEVHIFDETSSESQQNVANNENDSEYLPSTEDTYNETADQTLKKSQQNVANNENDSEYLPSPEDTYNETADQTLNKSLEPVKFVVEQNPQIITTCIIKRIEKKKPEDDGESLVLLEMELFNKSKFVKQIIYCPFSVIMTSDEQILALFKVQNALNHPITVYIDAISASVISPKFLKTNPKLLFYSCVVASLKNKSFHTVNLPIAEMITFNDEFNLKSFLSYQHWSLENHCRESDNKNQQSAKQIVSNIVCNLDWKLLNLTSIEWNCGITILEYINLSYDLVTGTAVENSLKTLISFSKNKIAQQMEQDVIGNYIPKLTDEIELVLNCLVSLTATNDFQLIRTIWLHLCILLSNKLITKAVNTSKDEIQKFSTLTHPLGVTESSSQEEYEQLSMLDTLENCQNSKYYVEFSLIMNRKHPPQTASKVLNAFYNKSLLELLLEKYFSCLPLWTDILLPERDTDDAFGFNKVNIPSPIENHFYDCQMDVKLSNLVWGNVPLFTGVQLLKKRVDKVLKEIA